MYKSQRRGFKFSEGALIPLNLDVIIRPTIRAAKITSPTRTSSSAAGMNARICFPRCLSVSRLLLIGYAWQLRYCSLSINHRRSAELVANYPARTVHASTRCWWVDYVSERVTFELLKLRVFAHWARGRCQGSHPVVCSFSSFCSVSIFIRTRPED